MQQYYGLALPVDPAEFDGDPRRFALLWTALPRESRTVKRLRPQDGWDDSTYILRAIEHAVRCVIWMQTDDAKKGINRPKPIELPWEVEMRQEIARESLDHADDIARALGIDPETIR